MPRGCSAVPIRETTLLTGEGESLVSSHCLKSRDSLDGVGEEGTALEEVEVGGITFEELGRVGNASDRLALADDEETSRGRLREEDTTAGAGEDVDDESTISSRFLKNFFGGWVGVGGEGGLGLDLLPLLATFGGGGFSFSSPSSSSCSSTLPFLPPCSSSSSTATGSSSSLPLPLVLLPLPLFCPGLGPGFLLEEARGGLSIALLTSLSLVTGSEPLLTCSDAFKSASTY